MPEQTRQLAAIMFTDIEGYTALMQADEEQAVEHRKKHRRIFESLTEKYQGRILQYYGDGTLSIFDSTIDAVMCAIEMQIEFQKDPMIPVRIGIHSGDIIYNEEGIIGDAVNVASRIESLAAAGSVFISGKVHDDIKNQKSVQTQAIGTFELKNVKRPVDVYALSNEGLIVPSLHQIKGKIKSDNVAPKVAVFGLLGLIILIGGFFFYQRDFSRYQAAGTLSKSIAVLPFRDDSEGSDNQYFCDGMMDEILNHLQKIADLGVKSRTAVEPYRNSTQSFAAIAQELEVAFILEGAVRKYGNRFRLTAQLIEVESGNHLWAETYDGIFSDTIFVVQSHIAKKIASSLNAVITPDEEKRIDKIPTTDIVAYDLVIRANHEARLFWRTAENKHLKTTHDLLDRALRIDPEYLNAIVAKGGAFMAERNYDSAFIYADRAIVLDPEFNRGYGLKGECYWFLGKGDLAIKNYSKAINLPPQNDQWLWYHVALGQAYSNLKNDVIKALPYLNKGLEMGSDGLPTVYTALGISYLNIGDYEKSEDFLSKALELHVSCWGIWSYNRLMVVQGKFQQTIQFTDSICQELECEWACYGGLFEASLLLDEFEKAEQYFYQLQNVVGSEFSPFDRYMNYQIGYIYYQLGRTEEAEKTFTEQIQELQSTLAKDFKHTYLNLARIYAFQGDRDEALNYLAEYADRGFTNGRHDFILIDPFFESLRDDPKFQAIVKRAQEEKAALRAQVREMEERGELDL